ncbi:MAG: hypothetical protein Q9207_002311 [Kuettlingeria erythrocarpa]
MGAFWTSWQLWQKLTFVMGVAIVLVVFAGIVKLLFNQWQLRKYTALAKTRAARKEEEGLQHTPSVGRRKKGNDVPFGVRAIESGIEVDGVWISRSNTPANSTPGSPALLANQGSIAPRPVATAAPPQQGIFDRASTASDMSRLEIPPAAHGHSHPSPRLTTSSYSRVSGNPFERSISSERSPTRPGSSYSDFVPGGRPSYQPRRASHLRFSKDYTTNSAEALATLEGKKLASKTGSKSSQESAEYEIPGQRASDDSWSGSSGEARRPYVRNSSSGVVQPVPFKPSAGRYNSSDLDALASHRRSHAAETGQLYPRVRLNDSAEEWTGVQQPAEHRNFLSNRTPSPMSTPNDPFATPQRAPSFDEFVRSTSPQGQYYLGEEGIPLQQHFGNPQGIHDYDSETVQQPSRTQVNQQGTTSRKASSFSEAV